MRNPRSRRRDAVDARPGGRFICRCHRNRAPKDTKGSLRDPPGPLLVCCRATQGCGVMWRLRRARLIRWTRSIANQKRTTTLTDLKYEAALAAQAQAGDEAAFGNLWTANQVRLRSPLFHSQILFSPLSGNIPRDKSAWHREGGGIHIRDGT